jgi:hypothetical protein
MHKIIMSGAIALTVVGTGALMANRADAGPMADQGLHAAADSLDQIDTVICRRHERYDRDRHSCGHVVPHPDVSSAVRLDESGLPDSRRRITRW